MSRLRELLDSFCKGVLRSRKTAKGVAESVPPDEFESRLREASRHVNLLWSMSDLQQQELFQLNDIY